jgi:hypothetical protein
VADREGLLPKLSEINRRENNAKIAKLRAGWQNYSLHNHCWRLKKTIQKTNFQLPSSPAHSQQDEDENMEDLVEELLSFSHLLRKDTNQQQAVQ